MDYKPRFAIHGNTNNPMMPRTMRMGPTMRKIEPRSPVAPLNVATTPPITAPQAGMTRADAKAFFGRPSAGCSASSLMRPE